jgi:hypothetical protein
MEQFAKEELIKYENVLHISGNHEFYHGVIEDVPDILRNWFAANAPNTRHLSNESIVIDGVLYIATTLWATYGYNSPNEYFIQRGMNDCRLIATRRPRIERDGSLGKYQQATRTMYPYDFNALHEEALDFLKQALETASDLSDKKCVVLSHHTPSYQSGTRGFNSDLDAAYCSKLDEFILDRPQIEYWLHGHTHIPVNYSIGTTKVISNPRGYPGEMPHVHFDPLNGVITPGDLIEAALSLPA